MKKFVSTHSTHHYSAPLHTTNIVIVCEITMKYSKFLHEVMNIKSKQEIRQASKAKVKALTPTERSEKSLLIFNQVAQLPTLSTAGTIALYASLPDEPQTASFIEQLAAHHRVVLPRVCGDEMDFYPYSPEGLSIGSFGISEPQSGEVVSAAEIDVIVVPGVSFTTEGKRIGRGRGYYDRYLSRKGFRATKVGVCYKEQLTEQIPDESHDVNMDYVIFG